VVNETEISKLLDEGLRHYAVGDPSRALEAWFKVLEAVPAHPRALEYVEYVRKSYRVENDAASLTPIVSTSDPADVVSLGSGDAPVVEVASSASDLSLETAPAPASENAPENASETTLEPRPPADQGAEALASTTTAESWQVQVTHTSAPVEPGPSSQSTGASSSATQSDWGVAATMDWGALVDDDGGTAAAATEQVSESAPNSRTALQLSPLPPTSLVVVPDVVEEPEPSGPVVAARWTTEASPAGAQDRADHGGFEDAPLPEFNDWPVAPGGFAQQIRAGSTAVVEISGEGHGGDVEGPVPLEAGPPPPPDDGEAVGPTPPQAEAAALPVEMALAVDENVLRHAASSAGDSVAPLADPAESVVPVDVEERAASENDDDRTPQAETVSSTPAEPEPRPVDEREPPSSAEGEGIAVVAAADSQRLPAPSRPATLLEASWGDLIDEPTSVRTAGDDRSGANGTSAPHGAAPLFDGTPDDDAVASRGAMPEAASMHLVPLEEHTPSSTRMVNTEENGPPPPSPSELQSDDGSAPVIRMDGPADPSPELSGPGADVLAFPTGRGLRTSTDESAVVAAPDSVVEKVADPVPESASTPTGEAMAAETSTRDAFDIPKTDTARVDDKSPSTAESNPISTEERYKPPAGTEDAPGVPAVQFRALAVEAAEGEAFVGVHRTSKVSDSSIVVNPAEDAKRVGVSEVSTTRNTERMVERTAVANEKSARVLRFDSYEGEAAQSSEGAPLATSTTTKASPVTPRADLENDDTIRVTRPPVAGPEVPTTTTADAAVPASFAQVPSTGPEGKPPSPWDAFSGESDSVDLDATSSRSVFDDLMSDEDRQAQTSASTKGATDPAALETFRTVPSIEESAGDAEVPENENPDTEPVNQCAALMEGARELFSLGDFSGSLELVEKVLALEPDNLEAKGYLQKNEGTLMQMYASKLGDLRRAPRLLTKPDEVIWMNLHHRAGFLLSQVDGNMTYEDLAEISGMSRLETYRILADLVQNGVITS
jgi:hypothetical protein